MLEITIGIAQWGDETNMRNPILLRNVAALGFWLATCCSSFSEQGNVAVAMQFTGLASCDIAPFIPIRINNVPFKAFGHATMRQDRNASMELTGPSAFTPKVRFKATLGGAPTRVPGGTAELRVVDDNELRMVWHMQTSSMIVNVHLTSESCSMSIDNELKPGARRYSLYDGHTTHMCAKPVFKGLSCRAL